MKGITEGFRDVLFSEAKRKRNIEEIMRNIFLQRGYDEIISPTLEFYNLFHHQHYHFKDDILYKLLDRKGNILVLKPDMTLPIARIITSKIKNIITPTKVFYISNIYRINESHKGRLNEFTQGGIEIVGTSSIKADIEVIITAIRVLQNLGFEDFKLELGHSGFYKAVTTGLKLDEDSEDRLKELMGNKNTLGVKDFVRSLEGEIDERRADLLIKLTSAFGGFEVLDEIEGLVDDDNVKVAIKELREIYSYIHTLGLDKYLRLDLGMVQEIDYYTGFILKGYVDDIGQTVLSGGRYDNLYDEFGTDLHSTGMAINIDLLCGLVTKRLKVKKKKILVWYELDRLQSAQGVIRELRDKYRVEACLLDSMEDCIRYFTEKGFDCLVDVSSVSEVRITTDNDIACGKYEDVLNLIERCTDGSRENSPN